MLESSDPSRPPSAPTPTLVPDAAIKALGLLFILGGVVVGVGSSVVMRVLGQVVDNDEGIDTNTALLLSAGQLFLMGLSVAVGTGLRRLRPWAFYPAIGLCLLSLGGFPMGTVVGLVGLFVLLNRRGRALLSPAASPPARRIPGGSPR